MQPILTIYIKNHVINGDNYQMVFSARPTLENIKNHTQNRALSIILKFKMAMIVFQPKGK